MKKEKLLLFKKIIACHGECFKRNREGGTRENKSRALTSAWLGEAFLRRRYLR